MKEIENPAVDIISDLPRNVIEIILTCLPTRDAVRTSILSRKWRYNWINLPKLVFDDTLCQELAENQLSIKNKLVLTIYQVLLLHHGPILEFTLSISKLKSCSEIDQLILFLSRNGVEKFTLRLWSHEHYKMPSSFFSYLQLTHLDLRSCVFKPPPTFKGFNKLISLVLDDVIFATEIFEAFLSSCSLLETLTLTSSVCLDYEIYAPKLKYLCVRGIVNSIRLKNAPLLAKASIAPKGAEGPVVEDHLKEGETLNLIELFGCLPIIEDLHMDYWFIKSLAAGGVPEKLPTSLIHLKILKLTQLYFGDLDEVSCALCLIRSSPNLQKITIQMFVSKNAIMGPVLEFLKAQDNSDVILDQLREVKMLLVSGMKPELEFIKLLLAKSTMLETMLIEPSSMNVADSLKMLQKLTRFQRASPKAKIIYEDPLPR